MSLKTAVVLLDSNGKTSEGLSVTTLCANPSPPSNFCKPWTVVSFGMDWLHLLHTGSAVKCPNGSLKFSRSLNDMGNPMDSLGNGIHFIDCTYSEGKLDVKHEMALTASTDPKSYTHSCRSTYNAENSHTSSLPPLPNHTNPNLVPSFTNNYKYIKALNNLPYLPSVSTGVSPLPHTPLHPNPTADSSLFLPFPRSSTSASLGLSELGSNVSQLFFKTSSSTCLDSSEFVLGPAELFKGENQVFVDDKVRTSGTNTHQGKSWISKSRMGSVAVLGIQDAPLCYMDQDSDLDRCGSPAPSEKNTPISPYSLSGDCCRWVYGWDSPTSHPPLPTL